MKNMMDIITIKMFRYVTCFFRKTPCILDIDIWRDTFSISQRSPACVHLQPLVSSIISSPTLSENRWNQIKTVGNEGNIFE